MNSQNYVGAKIFLAWFAIDAALFGVSRLNYVCYLSHLVLTPGLVLLAAWFVFNDVIKARLTRYAWVPVAVRIPLLFLFVRPVFYQNHLGDDWMHELMHQTIAAVVQSAAYVSWIGVIRAARRS